MFIELCSLNLNAAYCFTPFPFKSPLKLLLNILISLIIGSFLRLSFIGLAYFIMLFYKF